MTFLAFSHDSGKFSVVSVVTHKQLKKDYAAKFIDRSLCDNDELAKEVAIMQEIEEHPGVIHLKDVYEEAGSAKFVLILELYVIRIGPSVMEKAQNRPCFVWSKREPFSIALSPCPCISFALFSDPSMSLVLFKQCEQCARWRVVR